MGIVLVVLVTCVLTAMHASTQLLKLSRTSMHVQTTMSTGQHIKVQLNHGNTQTYISQQDRSYDPILPVDLSIFTTATFPDDERIRPTIGNGHIATVVYTDTVYMNGLYNGLTVHSHRARIPSRCAVEISGTSHGVTKSSYSLDVEKGMFIEEKFGPGFTIQVKRYAHRSLDRLLVTELVASNCCYDSFQITLQLNHGNDSDDIYLRSNLEDGIRHTYGKTKVLEDGSPGGLQMYMISTELPNNGTIMVPPGKKMSYLFLTAIDTDRDTTLNAFKEGVAEYFSGTLEDKHVQAWRDIWATGRVDIKGEPETAKVTYASLYYILSSIPVTNDTDLSFVGLSPGDLAHGAYLQDYQGHVFWDQETWMYPPIQVLHTDFGKTLIKSRVRTLDTAMALAKQKGYKGAMFPWESAYTGFETSPSPETADYEHHITGDISQAFYFYLTMSNDTDFMENGRGAELINSIAEFWASRVTLDRETWLYHINNVMPPDEYHWPVNDSVYTNQVAINSLLTAYNLNPNNKKFKDIADRIFLPFNQSGQWHPEYNGYSEGVTVKQADVILLGYPLMMNMSREVHQNDLLVYEKVTPGGPAMTWGMFAIGWLELNQLDKANSLFARQFDNVRAPFYAWSENANGPGAANFITGMGGYLQSVIFGYGGLRVYEDRIVLNGKLPLSVTNMNLVGLDYLGGSIDIEFKQSRTIVTLTKEAQRKLRVVEESTGNTNDMIVGRSYVYGLDAVYIMPL